MTKHKAAAALAYEVLDLLTYRVGDERGNFTYQDVEKLEQALCVGIHRRFHYPGVVRAAVGIFDEMRPDSEYVHDEDRAAYERIRPQVEAARKLIS